MICRVVLPGMQAWPTYCFYVCSGIPAWKSLAIIPTHHNLRGAWYIQGPRILGGVFGSLRGYAGNVSPAAALDMVASEGNTYIIDLRSSSEKVLQRLSDSLSSQH